MGAKEGFSMDFMQISALHILKNDYKTSVVVVQPKDGYASPIFEVSTSVLLNWAKTRKGTIEFPYEMKRLAVFTPVSGKSVKIVELKTKRELLSFLKENVIPRQRDDILDHVPTTTPRRTFHPVLINDLLG